MRARKTRCCGLSLQIGYGKGVLMTRSQDGQLLLNLMYMWPGLKFPKRVFELCTAPQQ